MGPRARLDILEKSIISCPNWDSNPIPSYCTVFWCTPQRAVKRTVALTVSTEGSSWLVPLNLLRVTYWIFLITWELWRHRRDVVSAHIRKKKARVGLWVKLTPFYVPLLSLSSDRHDSFTFLLSPVQVISSTRQVHDLGSLECNFPWTIFQGTRVLYCVEFTPPFLAPTSPSFPLALSSTPTSSNSILFFAYMWTALLIPLSLVQLFELIMKRVKSLILVSFQF